MIRVLIVDDSPIVLHNLQRLLLRSPEIEVAGKAMYEAKEGRMNRVCRGMIGIATRRGYAELG